MPPHEVTYLSSPKRAICLEDNPMSCTVRPHLVLPQQWVTLILRAVFGHHSQVIIQVKTQ